MRVQVACARSRIERRTGFVVAVVFEGRERLFVVAENAGRDVAGEIGGESSDGGGDTLAHSCCALRISAVQLGEAVAEAGGVELGDLENADTALGTADAAGEMGAASLDGAGEFRIYDLDETLVAGRKEAARHAETQDTG
jgi:hypothetical protein